MRAPTDQHHTSASADRAPAASDLPGRRPAGSPTSSPGPALSLAAHHDRIRRRGVNRPLYRTLHLLLQALFVVLFRLGRLGREHVPRQGAVILAANHRSFLDPFVIGVCLRRPVYFMAKRELFERPVLGRVLNALGAFPVCRGESDHEAMETARTVLHRGDPLLVFPEGTRVRRGPLERPRRGVGRLALETGAPVVPVAVAGSERVRRGWRIRPCRVRVRLGRPLTFPLVEAPSPKLAAEVARRIWPCVELQWEWLGGTPPLRHAAVVGAGPMGRALAALLARAGVRVELGVRTSRQAEALQAELATQGGDGIAAMPVGDLDLSGADLVVLAVPTRGLTALVAEVGDRIAHGTAILTVSKGLVGPLGTTPSRYVEERLPARSVAWLGGPAHAHEAAMGAASVVLATRDRDLAHRLGRALSAAGLDVERSTDMVGCELAGLAKNLATLAASAAAPAGMNAAGAAAAGVFAEVHALARARGASAETFAGLAGTGDLVATALAPASRNRRAGELLAQGLPADRIAGALGATAEAIDAAPLLAAVLEREERPGPAASGLAALVEGRLPPDRWLESARSARGDRACHAA